MLDPAAFFENLNKSGIEFFSGVPDSLLKNICAYITDNSSPGMHTIAANEGNALSIGLGYHLASNKMPLIYMQNSGLGNIINPLLSLADRDVYSIPMLLMIGWRGESGVKDEPQHKKQGRITLDLLQTMGIPYEVITGETNDSQAKEVIEKLVSKSISASNPCALVVSKGSFRDYKLENDMIYDRPLFREQAIKIIVSNVDKNDIVVSTTGVASRELFEHREEIGQGHEKDFLTVGGMGHASQIALGIAMEKKYRQVFCLDGDGAFIMHMGGAAISANSQCQNYKHIIFNNSAHDSVGGQPTVGRAINIEGIAKSLGYQWAKSVSELDDIDASVKILRSIKGPALLEIQVKKGFRKDLGRPTTTPLQNKELFMDFLKD